MGKLFGFFLFSFVVGIVALQQMPRLPPFTRLCLVCGLLLFGLTIPLRRRRRGFVALLALLGGLAFGWGWAGWRAELRLADALSSAREGQDLRLLGRIASLPVQFIGGQRFVFAVESVLTPEVELGREVPHRLWLSRYDERDEAKEVSNPRVAVGERWAVTARLKQPHGTANPGGFDYEAWLLARNLRATGYVRADPAPERRSGLDTRALLSDPMLAIHARRAQVRNAFANRLQDAPYGGILTALAIGDQQAVPDAQWRIFNRTGTTHLMSISGLHVTLIGLFVMLLLNRLWRAVPRLCRRIPAQRASLIGGALGALLYALLAGFGIPAQRTCCMLALAALAVLLGRAASAGRVLLLTLAGVLLFDPWAVLSPGFWLSFGAVAALIWIGLHDLPVSASASLSLPRRLFFWLRAFGRTQWAATLATLPVLLWTFQQFPLVSPLANLIAIPVISFLVTPLSLFCALFSLLFSALPPFLPELAHGLIDLLMRLLEMLANAPAWQPPSSPFWCVPLATLGVFWALLPRGTPGRGGGFFLLLPLLFWPSPRIPEGDLYVTVLDVGQGQAVLLETAHHRLLYDAGPRYGFQADADNAGRRVVLPYLARRGIAQLDGVVLSHQDQDHVGGFATIADGVSWRRLWSPLPDKFGGERCHQGIRWNWDGIAFEFLHPAADSVPKGDNGDSCVLKVTSRAGRLLLPGDIDRNSERQLLARDRSALSAEILLAPHHGSRSSSSLPFVTAVGPEIALFSVGHRNRFGHPHPETEARYRQADTETLFRTDRDGAILLDFSATHGIQSTAWRTVAPRYWHNNAPQGGVHLLRLPPPCMFTPETSEVSRTGSSLSP